MHKLIEKAAGERRNLLEHECLALLMEYGIAAPRHALVKSAGEALQAAGEIDYPVALKIVSPDILHKSDAGCVKVNLKTGDELRRGFDEILENVGRNAPAAKIEGLLVMQNIKQGIECIIGMTRDAQLGTALMFGLGGIFVEVMEDVSLCLLPVSKDEAADMVRSIKGYKLLAGYRGGEPCDMDAIADAILKIGALAENNPEIAEIDVNPLFAYPRGVMPVDARILLRGSQVPPTNGDLEHT